MLWIEAAFTNTTRIASRRAFHFHMAVIMIADRQDVESKEQRRPCKKLCDVWFHVGLPRYLDIIRDFHSFVQGNPANLCIVSLDKISMMTFVPLSILCGFGV